MAGLKEDPADAFEAFVEWLFQEEVKVALLLPSCWFYVVHFRAFDPFFQVKHM